ncbi:hypothetical protein N431DRAFT_460662 [Stipitochalara longipes BDJ]|nr:hypothetical protein N431DRAFT_460662 [Stipitochalara longipes BDJ]
MLTGGGSWHNRLSEKQQTVIHEIWPSVSRQRAKTSKRTSKRYRRSSNPTLLKLPVELREIIFRQDLLEWTEGLLTPSLIIALRPHPQLYNEALDLFYSVKVCSITLRNVDKVLSMPKSVLKRLLSVDFYHRHIIQNVAGDSEVWGLGLPCIDILQHSNLRSLQLTTAAILDKDGSANNEIEFFVRHAVLKFSTFIELTLYIPIDAANWEKLRHRWSWKLDFSLPVEKINRRLGIPYQLSTNRGFSVRFCWDAGINGSGTLTWTDEEYWKSIKRDSIGLVYSRLAGCEKVDFKRRYPSQSVGFIRQKCLDCSKQSCPCHTMIADQESVGTPGSEAEGLIERYSVVANLDLVGIALAEATVKETNSV